MRPKQWTKNAFVFLPLIFDFKLFQRGPLISTIIGFIVLCALSSVVYLINDSLDVEQDRAHPRKKNRPIARGDVPVVAAIAFAALLAVLGLGIAWQLSPLFFAICAGYLVLQLLYSVALKHIALIDVFTIATGFVLRVAAGAPLVAAERFSPWLFVCTGLLALLLGFGKRRGELIELGDRAGTRAILREYNLPLLDALIITITAGLIVSFSFYTFSAPNLPTNHSMMLTIPVVLYGLFRYFQLIFVKGKGDAPDELVLQDRGLQAALAVFLAIAGAVIYLIK